MTSQLASILPSLSTAVENGRNPFPGTAIAGVHDMMQNTPATEWIVILRALGVKMPDNSYAPDPVKIIRWTLILAFGIPVDVVAAVFLVIVGMAAVQAW